MKSRIIRISASIIILLIIAFHFYSYHHNQIGLDQLIPCLLGYLALWGIFMIAEFGNSENKPVKNDQHENS